ncbi:MAG: hypothetical protein IPO81_15355 [Kouleothrix sp.]|nr:hypothetical protein [Kouleothrix sp.]
MIGIGHNQARRVGAAARPAVRSAPALLATLALLHGLLYAWLVPPWQVPDEPAQFEYAALIAALGRTPTVDDRDAALDAQITRSLVRERFFEYLLGHPPPEPPQTIEQARALFFMPSQIGGDPPLYFWLAVLPIRLLAARSIEAQLLALRLLGALLTAGAVLCVYGAARELVPAPGFALAAGLIAALQPMFVFVGVGAGNDSLANLIGAAIAWALLRTLRYGASPHRVLALAALALLGALTKRTLLPQALLLALLGAGWTTVRLARVLVGRLVALDLNGPGISYVVRYAQSPRSLRLGFLAGALGLGAVALLIAAGGRAIVAGSRDAGVAAGWTEAVGQTGARRALAAPGTGRAALEIAAGQVVVQELPDVAAEWAQNQDLHASARVWSAGGPAHGMLLIDFGWATVEQPFDVDARGREVRLQTLIPLYCPYVHVGLRATAGTIYADRLDAQSDRRRGLNLLSNGDLTEGALRPGSLPWQLGRYLHVRELAWTWRSGRLLEPPPLGWDLARIFFVSFWGQFGWMSLPLIGGTPWEGALWLICAGGLLGTLGWLAAPGRARWRRRSVALLLLVIASGLLPPLLNAYIQPRSQAIQQGRYLFPMLAPIALLLALGWRALLPRRWRAGGLALGAAFAAAFAAAALRLIVQAYAW